MHRTQSHKAPVLHHWLDPLVLALAAPLVLFPERFPREAVVLGLALLAVPYGVRWLTEGRLSVPSIPVWAILFLVVVVLPINVWQHPYFWELGWPELIRLVWGLAACVAVINWCNPRLRPRRSPRGLIHAQTILDHRVILATVAYLVLGLGFVAVGLLDMRANNKLPLLGDLATQITELAPLQFGRMGFNPNRVASVIILFLPLTFALLLSPTSGLGWPARISLKLVFLMMTLVFGGALALTQSRAGLLATVAALLLVMLLAGRRGWLPLLLCAMTLVAALDIMGPSALMDMVRVPARNEVEAGTTMMEQILTDNNVAGRLMIWERALYGIQDQPLTGMGLAVFQRMAIEPYPRGEWRPDPDLTHAHNLFLQTGLDLGIPGLIAFLIVVIFAGVGIVRLFASTLAGSPARYWSVGMVGVWVAFVLYNQLDATTIGARPAITYWVMLGLCIGMGEQVTLFKRLCRHYAAHASS